MVSDMEVLCGPCSKTLNGPSFIPEKAVPVDIFPLTDHCEMVISFNRLK
jgi:tRNA (uracil-5-)-methyltransferase